MGRAVDWPLVYTVAAFPLGSVAASLTAVVGLLLGVPRCAGRVRRFRICRMLVFLGTMKV